MSVCKNSISLANKTAALVKRCFPSFGPNKKQEITRLVFEIAKKENQTPKSIVDSITNRDFKSIKDYLIRRRYILASLTTKDGFSVYLSRLKLDKKNKANIKKQKFYPKKLFIEQNIASSDFAKRFIKKFPKAKVILIPCLKEYLKKKRRFKLADYNKRRDNVFLVEERFDLFKKCPCTKRAVNCGYHIFNLGFGCIFDCTYCYLQEYTNVPGIVLPENLELFFKNFKKYKKKGMRIGTGEFSDSLMLDDLTEYSVALVNFFNKHTDVTFEFKTKSDNIKNLLKLKHKGNIVISWSLNPQKIIDKNEFFTASLNMRLNAAQKCAGAGYRIGFHFDPIFYYTGWEKDYKKLINKLFLKIKPKDIAWISLGTFRFAPSLKNMIEVRFPENEILDEELIFGFDRKLRYPNGLRLEIYQKILEMFKKHTKGLPIYLCMEEKGVWERLRLTRAF